MTELSEVDQERYRAWAYQARKMHQNKRGLAYAGCAAGVAMMAWMRFGGGPDWALWAGLCVIVASWAAFAWIIWDRFNWVKANAFEPQDPLVEEP